MTPRDLTLTSCEVSGAFNERKVQLVVWYTLLFFTSSDLGSDVKPLAGWLEHGLQSRAPGNLARDTGE